MILKMRISLNLPYFIIKNKARFLMNLYVIQKLRKAREYRSESQLKN